MHRRALLSALATLPVLAACGTTDAARTPSAPTTVGAANEITVTDGRGKTVTLAAPAKRVATLEWGQTEDVVTLGVQPVAVADPKGYSTWATTAKLTGSPVDVGLRTEPSLESVAKAEPDLILGVVGSIPEAALAQAEQIAPVVLLTGADAARPVEHMRANLATIATLIGAQAAATSAVAALDAKIAAAANSLAGKKYVFTYINATANTVDFRMHGDGSLVGAIAKQLGLTNAWTGTADPAYGIGSLDLEGFTTLPADLSILYWGNSGVDDPVKGVLTANPLWSNLDAVKSGRVHRVADGTWVYGGPASMTKWVDELVAALG